MNKSELREAVINYAIDICSGAIRVIGIKGILEDNDKEQVAKSIIEVKNYNYDMIYEILDDFNYNLNQRAKVIEVLENESDVAAMTVKHCYDNYRRTNK